MKNANIVSKFQPTLPTFEVEYFIECTTFSACCRMGGGVATKLGRNIQTFIYSKTARGKKRNWGKFYIIVAQKQDW